MKRILFLFLAFISFTSQIGAQQNRDDQLNLSGMWIFERAEYMERSSLSQSYQVKHTINNVEDLYAYSNCFQELVKRADIQGDIALLETLFAPYIGRYSLLMPLTSYNKQVMMQFGNEEDLGKDSPLPDLKFNAGGTQYLAEIIDENAIGITLERTCYEEGVFTQSAVRCIMKREN